MPLLKQSEIDSMRLEIVDHTCSSLVTIQRSSKVSDGQGGYTETYTTIATVMCAIGPAGENEQQVAARLSLVTGMNFVFPYGTDINPMDRIVANGHIYEINGLNDEPMSYQLQVTASATEIT